MKNYYHILGLHRYSSEEEILNAYHKLKALYHPDNNNGSKLFLDRFNEVNEAYTILSNPEQRAIFDKEYFSYFSVPQQQEIPNVEDSYSSTETVTDTTPKQEYKGLKWVFHFIMTIMVGGFVVIMHSHSFFDHVKFGDDDEGGVKIDVTQIPKLMERIKASQDSAIASMKDSAGK